VVDAGLRQLVTGREPRLPAADHHDVDALRHAPIVSHGRPAEDQPCRQTSGDPEPPRQEGRI